MFFRSQVNDSWSVVGAFLALGVTSGEVVLKMKLSSALMDLGVWRGECFVNVLTKERCVLWRMLWVTPVLQRICILLQSVFVSNCYDNCTSQSYSPPALIQVGCVPCTRQSRNWVPSSLSRVEVLGKRVVWFLMEPVLLKKWLCGLCDGKMGGMFCRLGLADGWLDYAVFRIPLGL